MPEGHTIHRLARLQRATLVGGELAASSPQGRFAEGAARLDGRVLTDVRAVGKHLFYRLDGLVEELHVHLGLFGRFTLHQTVTTPTSATRLVLTRVQHADPARPAWWHLAGPSACELLEPAAALAMRARLGPDPLDARSDDASFLAALATRTTAIAAILLDQRVIAGVGNVYRAEALFVVGLHPDIPANALAVDEATDLWHTLRRMLEDGERLGRIVTITPEDRCGPACDLPVEEARYVYRRAGEPCRRCGTSVRWWRSGGRDVYACEGCQAPRPQG